MAKSNLDLNKLARVLRSFQNQLTPSRKEMKELSMVPGTEFSNTIEVEMDGHFTKDREGNFGFSGEVDAIPEALAGQLTAEAGVKAGHEQKLTGDGNLKIRWHGKVHVKVPDDVNEEPAAGTARKVARKIARKAARKKPAK